MRFLPHAGSRLRAGRGRAVIFTLLTVASTLVARASSAQSSIPVTRLSFSGECTTLGCTSVTAPDSDRARIARGDTLNRIPTTIGPRSRKLPVLFLGALAGGLVANSFAHVDYDPGGYRDEWNTHASFPDKVVHGLAAFALTSVGVDMKVRPVMSALAVCAAGAAFETTQGYVSGYDIGADCAGAALGGLWRHWRAK